MKKRKHTHIQALLPESKAMLTEGTIQQEIAEYYGLWKVVKGLLKRE